MHTNISVMFLITHKWKCSASNNKKALSHWSVTEASNLQNWTQPFKTSDPIKLCQVKVNLACFYMKFVSAQTNPQRALLGCSVHLSSA